MNQSARKFQAVLRACQPSTPPVSPSVRLCLTLGPRQQQAVENPPTHPPSFPSFLTLQCGSCKHTSLHSLLLLSPTHTHHKKRITQANHSREGFRSPSDSSVGQGALHLSPGVDVGLRERRGRMGKERAVAVTAASASVTERLSRSECFSSFFLSSSLCFPTLYPPFSVTVYLLLLQLFGFTIQHAVGRKAKAPSLNGQAAVKVEMLRVGGRKDIQEEGGVQTRELNEREAQMQTFQPKEGLSFRNANQEKIMHLQR